MVAIVAWAALTGCTGSGSVKLNPVDNPLPALKAGVYSSSAVDVQPRATHEVEPDFPPELYELLQGKAVVAFTVRANGTVTDPLIVHADDVLFGEAAEDAVLHWKFDPAEIKGSPVNCRMTLPFFFSSPYGYGHIDDLGGEPSSGDQSSSGTIGGGGGGGGSGSSGGTVEPQ